jgi:hypothetical protein
VTKPPWDFGYMPAAPWPGDDDGTGCNLIIALTAPRSSRDILRALEPLTPGLSVELLVARPPIFWWRLRAHDGVRRAAVFQRLQAAGIEPRYVASALRPSLVVPPRLRFEKDWRCSADSWSIRRGTPKPDPDSPGRWFLRAASGVAVDRNHLGAGSGTRLAVIDDEAGGVEGVTLDQEQLVNLAEPPRSNFHGTTMVALAVGTTPTVSCREPFQGVAPSASPRLYCIPKPIDDVASLPLAIVRAAAEGADVIMCASYIEGTTSPMLDDALEFAIRLGRKGRGAAVVFPVGRETSSPPTSSHASLSLSLGDPASDPRVFAIGPSGKEGGWFFWRDRKGRLRPFANRGPAVRWLAPGDDLTFPFLQNERLFHSESSGASAIAAGVVLLVMEANPTLTLTEVDAILTRTASPVAADVWPSGPLADRRDVDPIANDRDGHDAKHGYGRLHATRACLAASDPVCAALIAMGEDQAASSYDAMRNQNDLIRSAYSRAFGRWMVRAVVADASLLHGVKALVRHVRAASGRPERQLAHRSGSLVRQVVLVLRSAIESPSAPKPTRRVRNELRIIVGRLEALLENETSREDTLFTALAPLWDRAS